MTRNRFAWVAGIAGAAYAAWWWRHRAHAGTRLGASTGRGETIYRNTPEPTGYTGLGGGPT